MRVKIVANRLSEFGPATGVQYQASKDDEITVSATFGQHLCDQGWATHLPADGEDQYSSKPFTPGPARLQPDALKVEGS